MLCAAPAAAAPGRVTAAPVAHISRHQLRSVPAGADAIVRGLDREHGRHRLYCMRVTITGRSIRFAKCPGGRLLFHGPQPRARRDGR